MLIMPLFSRTQRALPFLFLLLLHPFFVCEGARILSLSMFASRSHKNVYEPLLLELSRRGHEVTSVNPVRSSSTNSSSNASSVREIVGIPIDVLIPTSTPAGGGGFNVFDHIEAFQGSMFSSLQGYLTWLQGTQRRCPEFFALPQIQAVLQPTDGGTEPPFDLVLINPVSNECLLGAVHRLGVPSIFITTLTTPFWVAGPAVGDPTLPSHIPSFFSMVPPNAVWPFRERLDAFLCHVLLTVFMDFVYYPWVESLYRAEFGSATPGVHEIMANASLILSNSHYSLNFPRPTMPNHIDVGGMHCRPARPLPADLDEFLSGSGEEGFIYFSMGSVIVL